LGKLKVIGVMIGENRRAICQVDGFKENIILREGEKVGIDNAELKAILPGGVVFVEKITNVYGQEEYLETIIPVSK
jgi:type IV pilus assembly protein PilP